MTDAEITPYAYVLAVHDLVGSTAYFRDVLGFVLEWNDEDRWQALRRGQVRVNLGRCSDALPPAEIGDHNYFGLFMTQDVDDLHREFMAKGAMIVSRPADKVWGFREMGVATPEGHRMIFAQLI